MARALPLGPSSSTLRGVINPILFYMILAVVLTVIFSSVLGGLWYSPMLFMKPWMKSQGMDERFTPNDAEKKKGQKSMSLNLLMTIVAMIILSYFLSVAITYVPFFQQNPLRASAIFGFLLWLGFVVHTTLQAVFFERKNWKTAGINLAYRLIELVGASMIIGAIL